MRRTLLTLACLTGAALIATGCGQFGNTYTGTPSGSTTGTKDRITKKPFTAAVREKYGCGEVKKFESEGQEHVETDVDYKANPPHSGNHSADPGAIEWGVYDGTQQDERWVHNLEHGHLVITYKGISKAEKKRLLAQRKKSPFHLVIFPRKKNPKEGIYYTTWAVQLYCEKPSPEGLQKMINDHQDDGPELVLSDPGKGDS